MTVPRDERPARVPGLIVKQLRVEGFIVIDVLLIDHEGVAELMA